MSRRARRLFAGIDVSKSTLAVALQGLDGVARDLEFSNDADGHHKLVRVLTKGKRTLARTVVEATSTYAFDLCFALAVGNHHRPVAIAAMQSREQVYLISY